MTLRNTLKLSSNLGLGLSSALFLSGFFRLKFCKQFIISPIPAATCPTHFTILDFITVVTFGDEYKL
jgi:hypothetical protein